MSAAYIALRERSAKRKQAAMIAAVERILTEKGSHIHMPPSEVWHDKVVYYGVATHSKLLKNIGLCCKRAL